MSTNQEFAKVKSQQNALINISACDSNHNVNLSSINILKKKSQNPLASEHRLNIQCLRLLLPGPAGGGGAFQAFNLSVLAICVPPAAES